MLLQRMCSVSRYFWALDLLHITDYNGVSGHCIGNVLCDIVRDSEYGLRTQQASWDRFCAVLPAITLEHGLITVSVDSN